MKPDLIKEYNLQIGSKVVTSNLIGNISYISQKFFKMFVFKGSQVEEVKLSRSKIIGVL